MSDATFESLLGAWWEYQKRSMFTAIPARVENVRNMDECRVDVKPLVNMVFAGFENTIEWPPILHVPVVFPSSSSSAITFPVNQGDIVLVVFSQQSTDVFRSGDGTPQPPIDYRTFDKRDAIAIPGLWPFGMSKNNPEGRTLTHSTEDVVIAHNIGTDNECEIRLTPSGAVKLTGSFTKIDAPLSTTSSLTVGVGATGSFTTPYGQVVTVTDGIITNIY